MSKLLQGIQSVVRPRGVQQNVISEYIIEGVPREYMGRRAAARERSQGRVPAVVISQGILKRNENSCSDSRKALITTEIKQMDSLLKNLEVPFFLSTKFLLQIRAGPGSSHLLDSGDVLPIKVHKDKETGKLLNLVFLWAEKGEHLEVDVPVVVNGLESCPGIKKGGSLNKIRSTLKFLCPAENIPQKIEVDVSKLDIEEKIYMQDVEVHPSLKLLSKNELIPICKIVGLNEEKQRVDLSTL